MLNRFILDVEGTTVVEYALVATLLGVVGFCLSLGVICLFVLVKIALLIP